MSKTILLPLPQEGFDPTEVAVPWKTLTQAGHRVVFATPTGQPGIADQRMVTGAGLGPWQFLRADRHGLAAYREMLQSNALASPLAYDNPKLRDSTSWDGLILPGGHVKSMRVYLDSPQLQQLVSDFFAANKPVGAVCHGVLLAVRSRVKGTQTSVLHGRRTTALTSGQELGAWLLTCLWLGNYYRTYPVTVESEVRAALRSPSDFESGPMTLRRDHPGDLSKGFVVRDGNFVSARWPGDVHRFAQELLVMVNEGSTSNSAEPNSAGQKTL